MRSLRTAFIESVDFQCVNVAERRCLAELDVPVGLGNNGWFSVHRVGVPGRGQRCYNECKRKYTEWDIHTNHHLHPKVHDGAVVVWKVQTVSFELLKVSEAICWEIKSGNVYLVFAINILYQIWTEIQLGQKKSCVVIGNYFLCTTVWNYLSRFSATLWWRNCPGQSGTARARSPGRAWTHGRSLRLACSRGSAETQSVFHRENQGKTNTLIYEFIQQGKQTAVLTLHCTFTQTKVQLKGDYLSKQIQPDWNTTLSPRFWLDVDVVPLVGPRNKTNAGTIFYVVHSLFYQPGLNFSWKRGQEM